MACRIRYLNSSGIHIREIPGVEALSQTFPSHWLLYASLQCYPARGFPIEIDVMVVMDDRVLLLEMKDWNGSLAFSGDQWFVNGQPRGRSAVDIVSLKGRKIKTILNQTIPGFSRYIVDTRVVLTGTATKTALSAVEQEHVCSLQEACSIATPAGKSALLRPTTLHHKKAFQFEAEFERVTRNSRMWQPTEHVWDGYRVIEEDLVVHPRRVWREHRAERVRDSRFKALLRIWSFDQLPPGLNSPEHRRFIADREVRAIGHLNDVGSRLVREGGVLALIGEDKDEILTQHFDLRALPPDWRTLDRYLEMAREDLTAEDRMVIASALLNTVAELHTHGIVHRDLGFRCIWTGGPTKLAISGFMTCQIPNERSIADWCSVLRGYSAELPEDTVGAQSSTGKQRDVYSLGRLTYEILAGTPATTNDRGETSIGNLPQPFEGLSAHLRRATDQRPSARFSDAIEMADEFASQFEQVRGERPDQTALDRAETSDIPYVLWQPHRMLSEGGRISLYLHRDATTGEQLVVKVWPGIRRGMSVAVDLAMIRLFDGVSRLQISPIDGIPQYVRAGLSPVGPFLSYRHVEGVALDQVDQLTADEALQIAERLIHCVDALHALDCSHSDISNKNILVTTDRSDIRLLDLFDIAEVGDGHVRTPHLYPDGWERLSEQQIDRYAAISVVCTLLKATNDERFSEAVAALDKELERSAIETLEPATIALRQAAALIRGPAPPRFEISMPGMTSEMYRSYEGRYYLRVHRPAHGRVQYNLAGLDRELNFEVTEAAPLEAWFSTLTYNNLIRSSQHGLAVEIGIEVTDGPIAGLEALFTYLQGLAAPPPEPAAKVDDERAPPSQRPLDVARYWRKLIDLEAAFQPEIEILQDVGTRGVFAAYSYERLGGDFDFDTDSTVEVRLPSGRKIGDVDLAQTNERTLVVRYLDWPLSTGDRVNLVDRRAKASLDRRTKGVERILENEAAIPGLIGYFSPAQDIPAIDYGIEVPEKQLAAYELNVGQKAAFRHVVRYGPVGLLQGPPGTGKTRFIAALVHWLVAHAGARKILVASQAHEAVNNAIENLIDLYKRQGSRPSLLRIGSKGITEKIRPYHTNSLRERYQVRFDAAFKHRVTLLGTAVGLKRPLINEAIEIDRRLGRRVRYLQALAGVAQAQGEIPPEDRRRAAAAMEATLAAFAASGREIAESGIDVGRLHVELDSTYEVLTTKHQDTSPADITKIRHLIELSLEWSASLASSHRNFEEFLAKTRTIVTATCVGVGQTRIRIDAKAYDWVIVDEAARCTSGELAVPIQIGRRVLLVGDHLQLRPMIDRPVLKGLAEDMPDVARQELRRSDFERAYTASFGQANGQILTEQYRMAPPICNLVSKVFYEPHNVHLTTSPDRKPDALFAGSLAAPLTKAVTWINTSFDQAHVERKAEWNRHSFWNPAEVEAVIRLLERISVLSDLVGSLANGPDETPIGIICMYSAQKVKLDQAFTQKAWEGRFRRLVRIDTVDSYQGKENAIVIVSLVRCNQARETGHVGEPNRCNVALSRAKERLFIVGAKRMWSQMPTYNPVRQVIDYIDADRSNSVTLRSGDI
jgi:serine/threonine protein kinase